MGRIRNLREVPIFQKLRCLSSWPLFCLLTCLLAWPLVSSAGPAVGDQARAERRPVPPAAGPDLTKEPTLYVVGYAHLDTQWRWDYVTTIQEYMWYPSGSSIEENDVNAASAESVIRQVLYGTHYFRREFGKTSAEYMLPDCFGFPASLPSILAVTAANEGPPVRPVQRLVDTPER